MKLVLILLSATVLSSAAPGPLSAVARRTFADLLAIPLEPPAATVTVISSKQEDGVILDEVSWPAVDGETVRATIARPAKSTGRLPALLCLHGSSTNHDVDMAANYDYGEWTRYGTDRKGRTLYGWARELARHGYVTLAMTQRGLDRRLPDTESRDKELLVRGRNVMGTIIEEIRQAVTCLARRPDVDPARIGATGISFGGITSFYTWLVDDRVAAAAPICGGIGSIEQFLAHGARTYHGIYWWIPGMLTKGDQGDFAAAMAPRPLMLWAPRQDIGMPNQGIDKFLEVVEPAYRQAGAADRLVIHRPPGEHALTKESVDAVRQFFDHVFSGR